MNKQKWKIIEPQMWKPLQKKDVIQGVLVNKILPKEGGLGLNTRYYISNEKGAFFVWGSAVLDERLLFVKINQEVKITYQGKADYKDNQMNLFSVEVAQEIENTVESKNTTPKANAKGKKIAVKAAA